MQIDMSISSGGFCHLGLRARFANRSMRFVAPVTVVPPRRGSVGHVTGGD
jgi:hypothetical protein